jgi:hypothetical protein
MNHKATSLVVAPDHLPIELMGLHRIGQEGS